MLLRSIHVVTNGKISLFLWLNNIPMCICVCVCHIFYIHSAISGHLSSFHILANVNSLQQTLRCIYLFRLVFSFSSDKYPEVELLDHLVVLFLIFGGNSILFSTVVGPIYISTNSAQAFPFLHTPANTYFLYFR